MSTKTCYPVHGLVPIVNTPFDEHLQIDWPSLERLIERGIADGIVGYIVPAVASEVGKLTAEERRRLVQAVAAIAGGRVQVIAGVSSEQLDESRELAFHAIKRAAPASSAVYLRHSKATMMPFSISFTGWAASEWKC